MRLIKVSETLFVIYKKFLLLRLVRNYTSSGTITIKGGKKMDIQVNKNLIGYMKKRDISAIVVKVKVRSCG